MSYETKRKSDNFDANLFSKRRKRVISNANSDSGFSHSSSMSSISSIKEVNDEWPSLSMLTKPDELVLNGRNRKRFPDPVSDRSILFACFDNEKNMLPKLSQYHKPNSIMTYKHIFKERQKKKENLMLKYDEDGKPSFYISLDMIITGGKEHVELLTNKTCNIMLADIHDHRVASECLPDGAAGYWVRIFGEPCKYTLHLSLWKDISTFSESYKKFKLQKPSDEKLMKIGELTVDLWNTGPSKKTKRRPIKKRPPGMPPCKLVKKNLEPSNKMPSFCSEEKYVEIVNSLREKIENGDYESSEKILRMYQDSIKCAEERDCKETKLFLQIEKSQMFRIQGDASAKKILQTVVSGVISKSPNKVFLLNRAYMFLAYAHIAEENYGTAEECLNVIQYHRKNGMIHEDIGMFYFLYAIIIMNFGKTINAFSHELWDESETFLIKAIKNFESSSWTEYLLYRAKLNLAHLHLFKTRALRLDFQSVESEINELYLLSTKFSRCLICYMNIISAELYYSLHQPSKADQYLEEAFEVATKFNFSYELKLIESVKKWWNDVQYNTFITSIDKEQETLKAEETNSNISEIFTEDYYADQNS